MEGSKMLEIILYLLSGKSSISLRWKDCGSQGARNKLFIKLVRPSKLVKWASQHPQIVAPQFNNWLYTSGTFILHPGMSKCVSQ